MCCGNNPDLAPAVNTAKCWAVPSMIFAILACIGFIGGAWVQGIGGILGLVGSSIIICCVSKPGEGAGSVMAAAILQFLGALAMVAGAVIGLIVYFGVVDTTKVTCNSDSDASVTTAAEQACFDLVLGITGIFIFPSVGLGVIAGILMLIAGVMSWKARSALNSPKTAPAQVAGVPV